MEKIKDFINTHFALLILVVFVVLAILGGAGYELTHTYSQQTVGVPGMSKYTDSDFGFSFWYPSGWSVQQNTTPDQMKYPGGVVQKYLIVIPPSTSYSGVDRLSIEEFYSPTETIIDAYGYSPMGAPGVPPDRYYFDSNTHEWMEQYPNGISKDDFYGALPTKPAGFTQAADISNNTIGGLHMFSTLGGDLIVPLSAHNFLVISSNYIDVGANYNDWLTKTIVASDPLVATPVSQAKQTAAIQAEKDAYSGQ
jgi:hypothetical protein